MREGNPYQSPAAAADEQADLSWRPTIGSALLGLAVVPPGAVAARVLIWPVGWAIEYLTDNYFSGTFVSFGFGVEVVVDELVGTVFFAGFNTLFIFLPLAIAAWVYRKLTPRRILRTGGVVAALWWVAMSGMLFYAVTSTVPPAASSAPGDPVLYQTIIPFSVVTIGISGPLPLLGGVTVYAWWIRRLEHAAVEAEDALITG